MSEWMCVCVCVCVCVRIQLSAITLDLRTYTDFEWRVGKMYFLQMGTKREQGNYTYIK